MTVSELLTLAAAEVGVSESPAGSNCVKYNTTYYEQAVRNTAASSYPWCCVFLWWLFRKAGSAALFYGGGKTASCGTLAAYAKANGLWVGDGYRPGDLVFLRFSGTAIQHIGLVESVRADGTLTTIEGNTGTGSDANGGQVQRRVRPAKNAAGAYRPCYKEETAMAVKTENVITRYEYLHDVPEKFRPVIDALMTAGILAGDGSDPTGNGDVINLSHDQVRMLVFLYRGGGFDKKLTAMGLQPVIS